MAPSLESSRYLKDVKKFVTIGNIDINVSGKTRRGWNGGYTALLIATQYGHVEIVEYLLSLDYLDINKSNDSGMSALHTAAYHNNNEVIMGMLVMQPGVNINQQNQLGWTPLDWALEYNAQNVKLIEILRRNGGKRQHSLLHDVCV